MFMGPWDQGGPWSPTGIGGVNRFLNRVWTLAIDPHGREPGDADAGALPAGETDATARAAMRAAAHKTLRDVSEDYDGFRFNTMVAKLMELANTLFRYRGTEVAGTPEWDEAMRLLLLMLAPAAPHITEELWSRRLEAAGKRWSSIHLESWPDVDTSATAEATREVPVQINGKLRDRLVVPADIGCGGAGGARAREPEGRGSAGRPHPGPRDRRGRRQARQHRRPRLSVAPVAGPGAAAGRSETQDRVRAGLRLGSVASLLGAIAAGGHVAPAATAGARRVEEDPPAGVVVADPDAVGLTRDQLLDERFG